MGRFLLLPRFPRSGQFHQLVLFHLLARLNLLGQLSLSDPFPLLPRSGLYQLNLHRLALFRLLHRSVLLVQLNLLNLLRLAAQLDPARLNQIL